MLFGTYDFFGQGKIFLTPNQYDNYVICRIITNKTAAYYNKCYHIAFTTRNPDKPHQMKKNLLKLAAFLSIALLFASCATSNLAREDRKTGIESSKETAASCFVQFNDGSIKNYNSLKLVTGVLVTPHLLADGKTKIAPDDIKAYQNKDHYAISQRQCSCGRKSNIAVEALPGFAVRIAKGKLNIYTKKFYNGTRAVDEFYLQQGNDGQIIAYSPTLMSSLLKNNPEALDFFKSKKYNNSIPKKLQLTAAIFNKEQLMSKN
jgi:hypothetical protein